MWNQGIHARSGVACADCHMPYKRDGALKISDHHVRSPALDMNRACQTCHKWPEEELKARVETIQERTFELRNLAMDALMDLINDIKAAKSAGRTDAQLAPAKDFQRKAQFFLDFVEAENSTGFHAPQEAARILGQSINFSRKGQRAVPRWHRPTRCLVHHQCAPPRVRSCPEGVREEWFDCFSSLRRKGRGAKNRTPGAKVSAAGRRS